jgi:hypothetical protein
MLPRQPSNACSPVPVAAGTVNVIERNADRRIRSRCLNFKSTNYLLGPSTLLSTIVRASAKASAGVEHAVVAASRSPSSSYIVTMKPAWRVRSSRWKLYVSDLRITALTPSPRIAAIPTAQTLPRRGDTHSGGSGAARPSALVGSLGHGCKQEIPDRVGAGNHTSGGVSCLPGRRQGSACARSKTGSGPRLGFPRA